MGVPPPSTSGAKANVNDPMDLGVCLIAVIFTQKPTWVVVDSTAFDAKTYYEQLITTSSLPTLLKRENDLLAGKIYFPPH
jgi:vacuolar protein sorting-associated protein 51